MSRPKQNVPSPEQIRAILAAREAGVALEAPAVVDKVERLEKQVESLVSRGKMTAGELREAFLLVCQKYDFMPADELARMVMERTPTGAFLLSPDQRIRVLTQLNKFVMPELKAVEVKGTVEHNHTITIIRYGDDGTVRREAVQPQKVLDVESEVAGA